VVQAEVRELRLTMQREARAKEQEREAAGPRRKISQVSQELMRGRNKGGYANYGELLFEEVRASSNVCGCIFVYC
jgi:hypothetical protein